MDRKFQKDLAHGGVIKEQRKYLEALSVTALKNTIRLFSHAFS